MYLLLRDIILRSCGVEIDIVMQLASRKFINAEDRRDIDFSLRFFCVLHEKKIEYYTEFDFDIIA